jgi:MFS family permease
MSNKPSAQTLQGLDWLNFFLADVQTGIGPFLAIYLASLGWNALAVGFTLMVGGIAGILAQTPAGALVDRLREKQALMFLAIAFVVVGVMIFSLVPTFWFVMLAQILIGGSASIFLPAMCAISLGVVGHRLFDLRQGRNQAFNSAGNVLAAIVMGLLGYWVSSKSVFFFVSLCAIPTILALFLIHPDDINYERARGAKLGVEPVKPEELLKDRSLQIFLLCAVMFHFANAAMLPILGEMLANEQGRSSMLFMSACVATTQLVISLLATWVGEKAGNWGRKPLMLIAFGVLPLRGVLYTLTDDSAILVAIQILDGICSGIFGIVLVLVIADLTKGSGRFNVTLGAVSMAVSIGAALSQVIAGSIAHYFSSNISFLFLATIASIAFGILYRHMPETINKT